MSKIIKTGGLILGAILALLITFGALGYIMDKKPPVPIIGDNNQERIVISQGTVGNFSNLRIGVVSILESVYKDVDGIEQKGFIAILSFSSTDGSISPYNEEVYVGKEFNIIDNTFVVSEIQTHISIGMPGRSSGSVVLLVKTK